VHKAENLTPLMCRVPQSGSLNLLEPSGPDQACSKIALLLTKYMKLIAWGVFVCVFAYVNIGLEQVK
jgi:hypothetical protein